MDELDERLRRAQCPAVAIGDIDFDTDNSALPCGFSEVERYKYLRQRQPDLVVVAARPGVGKTAFALQLATNVARASGPVLFFSLEMDRRQLKQRLVALQSETSINKLHLLKEAKKVEIREYFSALPLSIDDEPSLAINVLMARAIATNKRTPLSLIVVDYLQIVRADSTRSKADEVAEIAEKLKVLAKELKVPIMALAQMNRNVEGRSMYSKDPRPMMSDLADSAGIEKWSDVIMFLHRPELINKSRPGEVDVFVVKNRHGATEDFRLGFSGEITKFYDAIEDSL